MRVVRKFLLLSVLGIFFVGCKVKQTVSNTKNEVYEKEPDVVKVKKETKKADSGLYPIPEDTGEFVRFEIESPQEYIETFSEVAQMEMKTYGIPASITLAQGLLESGFGRGELALKTNNHFGIKCHTGWQGDYDLHDDDEKGECFRKYNHPMYSYRDHSIFLKNRSRYAFLFDFRNDDYKRWAKGLRQAGYATDKKYPQKLIALIERHRLYEFDKMVVGAGYGKQNQASMVASNRNRIYVVQQGDTLYSISRRYSVSVDDLKRWNYMYDNKLSVGQKLTVDSESFNK